MYDVLLEREDRIKRLGWTDTKEEAEELVLNYIKGSELLRHTDFKIWIEEDK